MKYTYVCKKNKAKKKLRNKTKKYTKISLNYKQKLLNKTQNTHNTKKKQKKQKGGKSNTKEKFEVHSIKNFDYDKYKISKGANIDWSSIGGPPPEPNCCIC
jgi:hypothetical protein